MSSRLPWLSFSVRLCALLFFYGSILLVSLHAQIDSRLPPESLRMILSNLDELALSGEKQAIETEQQARELAQNLRQASDAAASWKALYEELLTHLDEAQTALEESQTAQEVSRTASEQFTLDFNALSLSSTAYRVEVEKQIGILTRQRNLSIVGGVGVALVLVVMLMLPK